MSRLPIDPDFEPRIADWLEGDPDQAPGVMIDTVLAAFPLIPQRRGSYVPRRLTTMFPIARFAVAAVIGVLLVGGAVAMLSRPGDAGVVGTGPTHEPSQPATPGPSPTASPTPPAVSELTKRFTSKRHGYSVAVPDSWMSAPASDPWRGGAPDPDAKFMDRLAGPRARLVAASAPLNGKTPSKWRNAYVELYGGDGVGVCDVLPADQPPIGIGGEPGFLDGNACPGDGAVTDPDVFFEAVAFVGDRVYLFWLQGDVNRADFDRLLASVEFDPGAANDSKR